MLVFAIVVNLESKDRGTVAQSSTTGRGATNDPHPALLTFDVEDWFQLVGRRHSFSHGALERQRLHDQVSRILEMLANRGASATFFVLGMTAEACPKAIEDIVKASHEIGSHGFGHESVRGLSPDAFARDLDAAEGVIRGIAGTPSKGFRAAAFSIDRPSFWAFDVLLDKGFIYDSSIYPFRGRRYGVADFPLGIGRAKAPSGRTIIELPLSVYDVWSRRFPVAGGGYWRAVPEVILDRCLTRIAVERPPVLYFHPAEFDRRALVPRAVSLPLARVVVQQNLGRSTIAGKVEHFLKRHRCVSVAKYLKEVGFTDDTARPVAAS